MGTFAPGFTASLLTWFAAEMGMGAWALLFAAAFVVLFIADVKSCRTCP